MRVREHLRLTLLVLMLIPNLSSAAIDILVPAYANPCCDGGPVMWSSLISSASDPNRNYDLHVIFNPASGPGLARDANYLNDLNSGPLADFRTVGGITHGYVATGFGTRSLDAVKADIDAYLIGHYAGYVDGIFFDEMSNDLDDVGYYQQLHDYVQSKQSGATTIGNPGTTYTNNTSGQTKYSLTDYINSLDTIMTFENSGNEYENNYTSFPHLEDLAPEKIAHVIHSQETWVVSLLDLASTRGAGYLYITDDLMPNPYDALPGYWEQLTTDVSAHNASVVPVPAAVWLFGSGLIGIFGITKRKRVALARC